MQKTILMIVAVALVGCTSTPKETPPLPVAPKPKPQVTPNNPEAAAAIEAAIRKAAGKPTGELTKADLEKVKRLDLNNKGITDISALAELKELEGLNIHSNRISDLNPLVGLSKLVHLELYENQITDLKPLGRLNSLKTTLANGKPQD